MPYFPIFSSLYVPSGILVAFRYFGAFRYLYGPPQGSILDPLLFFVVVNDLPSIALSTAKLFSDDTKLYKQIINIMDCGILQDDLNEFSAWSKIWLIKFNAIKCIVLRLREAIR